jgi:hypothetical protein
MRIFILMLMIFSLSKAQNYTFILDTYTKEIELEATIIKRVASASLAQKEIRLFIPEISELERKVYQKFFTLSSNCEDANFIFVKKSLDISSYCKDTTKLIMTNNYRKLLSDEKYYGAFFWQKSRPNITFISQRLQERGVKLPLEFDKFIEDY